MKMNKEALQRLQEALPHFKIAASMAKIEGFNTVELAIVGKNEDGGGKIICSFRSEEFFADLEELLKVDVSGCPACGCNDRECYDKFHE